MHFDLDYFYGAEQGAFRYYRIPKALLAGGLSLEAAALYGLMLDRVGLSAQNGWTDGLGRVFIYFTQKDVEKFLRCGHNRATAYMRELERAGLIERVRQGLGRPAKIDVKDFAGHEGGDQEVAPAGAGEDAGNREESPAGGREEVPAPSLAPAAEEAARTARTGPHGLPGTGAPDGPGRAANDTKRKEPDWKEPHPILPQPPCAAGDCARQREGGMDEIRWVREKIRENIGYEELIWDYPCDSSLFDGYVELMTEAACSGAETVRLCGRDIPAAEVRSRFLKLERAHILYVRDCLCTTPAAIGNIKAYTLAALYNAPVTMTQYYAALACHDLAR